MIEDKVYIKNLENIIDEQEKEIERLKQLLEDSYKSAHPIDSASRIFYEKDKEIERLNNIINTMLDFNFFKEECPLSFGYTEKCDEEKAQDVFYKDDYCEENCNDIYKKCWLKYFNKLQELKGSNNNE